MFHRISLALLITAALLLAAPAMAVPITYTLEQGVEDGFGFSGLHDADDDTPMSGDSLGDLSGTLTLDYNAGFNTFTFVSSTVSLDSQTYSFEIVGGTLNGSGLGFLGFELTGPGPFAQTGEIVFAAGPVCCGNNGPNHIDTSELRLWGAVDIGPSGKNPDAPKRFGMDLGASANAVPEPSAAMVFGIGLVLVRSAVRRRSN